MKPSKFSIVISFLLYAIVFTHNMTYHHGNTTTNQLGGIQEELQLLKGTVQTLVMLVNVVTGKVDTNANNVQTLTSTVVHLSKNVDAAFKKVGSLSSKVDSVSSSVTSMSSKVSALSATVSSNSKKIESNSRKVDSTTRKLDSTAGKVVSNTKTTKTNSKDIVKLTDETSPLTAQCHSLPVKICGSCQCRDDKRLPKKYYCDCTNLPAKRDCKQFHKEGYRIDGVYNIHQNNIRIIRIFCDQSTDGGGWSVFQRRADGSVKFYRDWLNYKIGFGDHQHEFWLGNTNIFTLSLQGMYPSGNELRIELTDWMGVQRTAKYGSFELSNEDRKFQLNIGGYSGTAGDSLSPHNGMKFSTFDQDHDICNDNCAVHFLGGWWYEKCHSSNLNGWYYDYGYWQIAKGACWWTFHGHEYSLKHVEMKVRRKG